jgi:hypothetical protein
MLLSDGRVVGTRYRTDVEMAVDLKLDKLLRESIETKHLLRFRYKGSERIVEPHDYGIDNGIVRLLCWQVGGRSMGSIPGWRLMDVDDMQDCEMLDRRFSGNREVPSGKHHRWDQVFIRVGPPKGSLSD